MEGSKPSAKKNSICERDWVRRRILLKLLPVRLSQAKANVHTELIKKPRHLRGTEHSLRRPHRIDA